MAVVQIETFRLADGVDEERFLVADRAFQTEFIPNLRGFLRRTTARGDDGEWLVATLWQSADDADVCAQLARASHLAQHFTSLVDEESFNTRRYTTLD